MTVLVLGGTKQGRRLAQRLVDAGHRPLSSMAGRPDDATAPPGQVRVGGFGGVEGLVSWLEAHPVQAVVDATHPFSETMTRHAVQACRTARVPYLRLARSSWAARPDASSWTWVGDHDRACRAAGALGAPVLLTIGRTPLWHYHLLPTPVTARVSLPDPTPRPAGWRMLVARGPFRVEDERRLLRGMSVVVCRDSGGQDGMAKLDAAAAEGVAVVMIERPQLPGPQVTSSDEVLAWLDGLPRR